jgi:hypothetical protein
LANEKNVQVLEVQRTMHGELIVLAIGGTVLAIAGTIDALKGERIVASLVLLGLGVLALVLAMQVRLILVDGGGGKLLVHFRSWGRWRVMAVSWDEIELHKSRLGLSWRGHLALPKGTHKVIGTGYFGVGFIDSPQGTIVIRLRNPERLTKWQTAARASR